MAVTKFLGSLLAVVFLHSLGVRAWADFPIYFDLYLVLTVAWAFESSTLVGLLVGLAAGLTADAFAAGPYGLHGFSDTAIGYLTAFAVARLAKMNTAGAGLLYAVASAGQQLLLVGLVLVLIPEGAAPPLTAVGVKVAITGVAGMAVFRGRRRFLRAVGEWRQSRESRLRF